MLLDLTGSKRKNIHPITKNTKYREELSEISKIIEVLKSDEKGLPLLHRMSLKYLATKILENLLESLS